MSQAPKPVRYTDLKDLVLYKFYGLIWSKTNFIRNTDRDLERVRPGTVHVSALTGIVNELMKEGLVTGKMIGDIPIYGISKRGIERIDRLMDKPKSIVARYRDDGDAVFGVATGPAVKAGDALPAPHDAPGGTPPASDAEIAEGEDALPVVAMNSAATTEASLIAIESEKPTAWNEADAKGLLDPPVVLELQQLIREMLVTLDHAKLPDRDADQIAARLVAAKQLSLAPIPPWSLVIEVLSPLLALEAYRERILRLKELIG